MEATPSHQICLQILLQYQDITIFHFIAEINISYLMEYFNFNIQVLYEGCISITFHDFGREWRNLRKCFLRGVKMYGTGLHELETLLADILEELVEVIKKRGSKAFVIEQDIYRTVAASMWLMVRNSDQAMWFVNYHLFQQFRT